MECDSHDSIKDFSDFQRITHIESCVFLIYWVDLSTAKNCCQWKASLNRLMYCIVYKTRAIYPRFQPSILNNKWCFLIMDISWLPFIKGNKSFYCLTILTLYVISKLLHADTFSFYQITYD